MLFLLRYLEDQAPPKQQMNVLGKCLSAKATVDQLEISHCEKLKRCHKILLLTEDIYFNLAGSLTAEINPLNQRRGSDFIFRENIRRDNSRDSISGMKNSTHPITSRSLSLQAPPVMERGPFAKRSRSTKKREGKTRSLICFNSTGGKYLEDLMWEGPEFWAFSGCVPYLVYTIN